MGTRASTFARPLAKMYLGFYRPFLYDFILTFKLYTDYTVKELQMCCLLSTGFASSASFDNTEIEEVQAAFMKKVLTYEYYFRGGSNPR